VNVLNGRPGCFPGVAEEDAARAGRKSSKNSRIFPEPMPDADNEGVKSSGMENSPVTVVLVAGPAAPVG
jgi:hypothetical protein